ncbi:phosphate-starvation-inducible PsiE family protein [Aphanizomenon sp. PH219]|uniref:Phosphate-starvation-inducible PsiE family protein n=1 Tax=Dolichospermum heterosporum TAC447 TaxID=747523 RepID=A0ABY5LVH9_9CYAN|nr:MULTISPECIES: phosphate-starvation-inducible PsiE family protein [Aphanizomenonaceae]MDK2409116.1 phosphate-starvation-inducible PsiE family protein [Aphanizomenon sp. 202]MDK2460149.1 phosphate-starvation-inducible PsiE family protein [Aphanizomenon sp. PH219]UUO15952.1 phosphate-starvation-inducible PsiE family protein [Dolichospermum heterosporum TAC447]
MRKLIKRFLEVTSDKSFMYLIEIVEVIVAKLLSLFMIIVIFATLGDLAIFIFQEILSPKEGSFSKTLFQTFGLFLNVLIALEILENITGYLKKHVLQVELVIVTSLIAIARKIIILDLKVTEGIEIIGLGIAILALSISYWIIRSSNQK